jgi:hypothetical protein
MTIFKSARVTELEGENAILKADNERISGELATAQSTIEANAEAVAKADGLEKEVAELKLENAEIPSLEQTIKAQKVEIASLKEGVKITDAKIEAAAAVKLAANGHHDPLDTSGDSPTAAPKEEIKNLTGLAKVTAFFKAQNASKTAAKSH